MTGCSFCGHCPLLRHSILCLAARSSSQHLLKTSPCYILWTEVERDPVPALRERRSIRAETGCESVEQRNAKVRVPRQRGIDTPLSSHSQCQVLGFWKCQIPFTFYLSRAPPSSDVSMTTVLSLTPGEWNIASPKCIWVMSCLAQASGRDGAVTDFISPISGFQRPHS